jgi:methylisocitrate lyase
MPTPTSAGAKFRAALKVERPLQVVGAITAYALAWPRPRGFKALYLSGGGVAANSLGVPDLGISSMDDVLIDIRRITDAASCRCWSTPTPAGAAHSTSRARCDRSSSRRRRMHIEDQVQAKRCGHRPARKSCRSRKWSIASKRRSTRAPTMRS